MATRKDSVTPASSAPDKVNTNSGVSLDWWAVIFALALVALVLAGLQVNW